MRNIYTLLAFLMITSNAIATDYFFNGTGGGLNVTSNWGINTDGTGTSPSNFTDADQIFFVRNITGTLTQTNAWTVSGSGSRIIFGDGTTTMSIVFDTDLTASTSGMVDVLANTTVRLNGTTSSTNPAWGTLSSGSTVIYGAAGAQTISAVTYANLTTDGSGTKSLAGNITVSGTLTLNTTLAVSTRTLTFSNAIAGTTSNLSTTSSSTLILNGTVNCTLPSLSVSALTLNNSGGLTLAGNLTVANTLTLTSGTLTVGANTLSIRTISGTASNISAGSTSSIIYQGTSSSVTFPTSISQLANLTVNLNNALVNLNLSSALTIVNTLTLTGGNFANSTNLTMADGSKIVRVGNSTVTGTLGAIPTAAGTYDVEYTGTGDFNTGNEIPTSTSALRDFTINKSSGTIALAKNYTVNRNFTISSGAVSLSSRSVTISGIFSSSAATSISTATTGTFAFSGAGSSITINGAECIFSNITVNASATLTAPNGSTPLNIRGNLVNNGTFVNNGGTVKFSGTGAAATSTLSGSSQINFNNLTIASGKTLNGVSSGTFGIAGNFVNEGTFSGNSGTVNFNGTTTITAIDSTTFNNITITGSLTPPSNLILTGNFTVDGTFTQGSNTVTFSGTSGTQDINGTSSTLTFHNMNVSGSGGTVRLEGCNAKLNNTLTIGAGAAFDADGSANNRIFTLVSNFSNGTARIATIPATGNLTGKITMERFTTGSSARWTLASTPVKGQTLANWQAFFPTTGYPGSLYPNNTFVSIRADEEAFAGSMNDANRYIPPGGSDDPITVGEGYWVYMGYRDRNLILSLRGEPQINKEGDSFDFGVTYSSGSSGSSEIGWNLIANPFPSEIDWLATDGWTKTNMDNAIYFYDASITSGSRYRSLVGGVSSTGATRFIANSQGIYVKANAPSPSLTADERIKTTNGTGPTFYRTSSSNEKPLVRIQMSRNEDVFETVIYFEQGATKEFDSHFDAYDLSATYFGDKNTFCTVNKGTSYSINGLPPLEGNTSVKLHASIPVSGQYTISAKDMDFIPQHYCIKLYDSKTNKYTNLRKDTYTFELDQNENEEARFMIYLEENSSLSFNTEIKPSVCGNSENKVVITPNNGEVCSMEVTDPSGNVIKQSNNTASAITLNNLRPGKYKITAKNSSFCGYAEKYFTIDDVSPNSVNHYVTNAACYGSKNAEILVAPIGLGPWTYTWYDSKHKVIKQTNNSFEADKLTNIGAGTYTVDVTFPKGCAAEIPAFNITSLPEVEASFSTADDILTIEKASDIEFINQSKNFAYHEWIVSGDDEKYLCENLTYSFPFVGTYQITLNTFDQCGNISTSSKNIEIIEKITDISALKYSQTNNIEIQQADKSALIKFNYSDNSDAVVSILNTLGQELSSPTKLKVNGQHLLIDLNSYGNQVLFISVTSYDKRITKKVVNY